MWCRSPAAGRDDRCRDALTATTVPTRKGAGEIAGNAVLGVIPGPLVIAAVTAFYAWLLSAILRNPKAVGELAHGEVQM